MFASFVWDSEIYNLQMCGGRNSAFSSVEASVVREGVIMTSHL
jgi:hypothetical protein